MESDAVQEVKKPPAKMEGGKRRTDFIASTTGSINFWDSSVVTPPANTMEAREGEKKSPA